MQRFIGGSPHQASLDFFNNNSCDEESEEDMNDDCSDDEAEKFKNIICKSSTKGARLQLLSRDYQESNLLLKATINQRMNMI